MSARLAIALVALALTVAGILDTPGSGASFTARTTNAGNAMSADTTSNHLRLHSQSTDPFGTTNYAIRRGSSPAVTAATGADDTLSAHLGGYRNESGADVGRVLTMLVPSPLPSGAGPVSFSTQLNPDSAGRQPLQSATLHTLAGASLGTSATLGAGDRVQLNVRVRTSGLPNNTLTAPTVDITVRPSGYTGNYLTYSVPVRVWTGAGAGPDA
jgi:hypothetical protein